MNPTDPYETGFPKKGTYEKIPYRDSVGDLGFRHLSLATYSFGTLSVIKSTTFWAVAPAMIQPAHRFAHFFPTVVASLAILASLCQ